MLEGINAVIEWKSVVVFVALLASACGEAPRAMEIIRSEPLWDEELSACMSERRTRQDCLERLSPEALEFWKAHEAKLAQHRLGLYRLRSREADEEVLGNRR